MTRAPGHYATRAGRTFRVVKASGTTWVEHRDGKDVGDELTLAQLDRLERVAVRARWRDGDVWVVRLRNGEADVWTTDADLAAREDLKGDVREGWQATVSQEALQDGEEDVSVVKGGPD